MRANDVRVLIIDDEELISWSLARELQHSDYSTYVASTGLVGMQLFQKEQPQVVLLDYRLPDADGLDLLSRIKSAAPDTVVILMTAYGGTEAAVRAIKLGAQDYVTKPVLADELMLHIQRGLEEQDLRRENIKLRQELGHRFGSEQIIGESPAILAMLNVVRRVAASVAPSVLVHGESGSGKEMVANALHFDSTRRNKALVAINCGALPASLMESELFGHEAGAFTDAKSAKKGQFEVADGGTLVLDEIGEMELPLQVKLLRVLESRSFTRVGGVKPIHVDVRVVALTNRNLEQRVEQGLFRQDLFYRLNVINIQVPPLRTRERDVVLLAHQFIHRFNQQFGKSFTGLEGETECAMLAYNWPGNVRELRNLVERAMILEDGPQIRLDDLLGVGRDAGRADSARQDLLRQLPEQGFPLEEIERLMLLEALDRCHNNQVQAARWLSISRDTLRYKMRKHGLLV